MRRIDFPGRGRSAADASVGSNGFSASDSMPTSAAATSAARGSGLAAHAMNGAADIGRQPVAGVADVTLLLEGTYPYVRGGVSSWVHDLITGLPEVRFALVYLGAEVPQTETLRYALPPNVVALHRYYLMSAHSGVACVASAGDPGYFAASKSLHDWFRQAQDEHDLHSSAAQQEGTHAGPATAMDFPQPVAADAFAQLFDTTVLQLGRTPQHCAAEFFHSEAAWREITENYARHCPDASLLSYFWAVRNTHAPLFKLAEIARAIPDSRIFHAVTTGYAGLLGAMLKRLHGRALMLTEHGIYTKERKMDLQAMFLGGQGNAEERAAALGRASGMAHHEDLWLRLFEGLGRLAYDASDPIISLYERNRQRQ
ncbi:MAG: GT4 family glycosyltransferase PelF, partial [Janthinobacterium lividum]